MKTRYKYIEFVEIPNKLKTQTWSCRNLRSGDELGQVRWYSAWRQYCYFTAANTIYNAGCLRDIEDFIGQLSAGRGENAG